VKIVFIIASKIGI